MLTNRDCLIWEMLLETVEHHLDRYPDLLTMLFDAFWTRMEPCKSEVSDLPTMWMEIVGLHRDDDPRTSEMLHKFLAALLYLGLHDEFRVFVYHNFTSQLVEA